jgi:4-hydroxythreonine-4-phosphate dehydrogenase
MKIGISGGDPAGIGLEVVIRALPSMSVDAEWVLYTCRSDFLANIDRFNPSLPWRQASDLESGTTGVLGVVFLEESGPGTELGRGTVETGRRALEALGHASSAALLAQLDGLVTAPLNKKLVGSGFTGHTDYLAEQAGVDRVAMTFFTPTFKVVLATTHVSLRDALDSLSTQGYVDLLKFADSQLSRYGLSRPKIAVAAINPHAGEGGMFGSEDQEILLPAVEVAKEAGLDVSGPHSADSLYLRAHQGEFDVVVAPYHDQGLIPVKLIAPRSAANVTLGLPYVRTSPDHGTAFQIAGQGVADWHGMETAMRWAVDLIGQGSGES